MTTATPVMMAMPAVILRAEWKTGDVE
jgi:hypothetical protein